MEQIKKLEKTIDIDALFRWMLRKWKKCLLIFCIAALMGSGLASVIHDEGAKDGPQDENLVMTEEEKEAADEYLEYDLCGREILDIIDMLEEDIEKTLGAVDEEKGIDDDIWEVSDKMKLLETYNSYYNRVKAAQNGLRSGFNEAQNAYVTRIEKERAGELGEKEEVSFQIKEVAKIGVKYGTMFGIFAVGIWGFVLMLIFGLNGKIKSKEDILAIWGDLTIIEGKRGLMKNSKVQIMKNLGIGEFLEKEDPNIVNLAGKAVFDVDNWNDKLAQSSGKEIKKEERVVLITEIGVSSYSDIIKMKKEYGESVIGCLCVR